MLDPVWRRIELLVYCFFLAQALRPDMVLRGAAQPANTEGTSTLQEVANAESQC